MASLGNNENTGDTWSSPYWQIYHRLTATVTRSGNDVYLTNITAYFHLEGSSGYAYAGTNYGPAYFYLEKGGGTISTSSSQTWNWSVSAPYSGDVATYSLPNCSFGVGASDTSATVTLKWKGAGSDSNSTSWTITFPSGGTPPSGGSITDVTPGTDSVTMTGGVSSIGTGGSSTNVELVVLNAAYTQAGVPQRYEQFHTLTDTKTVSNSSPAANGGITISPNTQYHIGIYASNGVLDYRYDGGTTVTLAEAPTVSLDSVTGTTATISYSTSADGGALSKEIQYSLDGGTTWVTGTTVSTGSASSGTFTISGLSGYTTYSVETRVHTTAGDSAGATLSVTTDTIAPDTPTVSVATNNTYNSLNVAWGTASYGAPNTGEVSIYSGTSASPTQLQYTKTTTGTSLWTNTGLAANTRYYYRARAKNSANVWSSYSSDSSAVTRAKPATVALDSTTTTSATISYSFDADGGEYDKDLEYSLDGTNWTLATTITGGSASSGTFTISGLTPSTAYTVRTRVTTTAGSSNGSYISVTTDPIAKLYGSVNGQAKRIQKMYGSVNGQAKKIVKIYGSVNGSAKLIYEDNS